MKTNCSKNIYFSWYRVLFLVGMLFFSQFSFAGQGWKIIIINRLNNSARFTTYNENCWYGKELSNYTVNANSTAEVYTEERNSAGGCDNNNIFINIPEKNTRISALLFVDEFTTLQHDIWFGRQAGGYMTFGAYGYAINGLPFHQISLKGQGGLYYATFEISKDGSISIY